jgi:hypothetical protein
VLENRDSAAFAGCFSAKKSGVERAERRSAKGFVRGLVEYAQVFISNYPVAFARSCFEARFVENPDLPANVVDNPIIETIAVNGKYTISAGSASSKGNLSEFERDDRCMLQHDRKNVGR